MTLPWTPQVSRIRPFSSAVRRTLLANSALGSFVVPVVEFDGVHEARAADIDDLRHPLAQRFQTLLEPAAKLIRRGCRDLRP